MNDENRKNVATTVGTPNWGVAANYEAYMGRWGRLVAPEFLNWLNVAPRSRWLDVGCGTGILTGTILRLTDPIEIKGIDSSAGFLTFAREQVIDPRVSFEVGDAQQLSAETGRYDAVVSGLVLNFIPDHAKALSEMVRVAKPDGVVAAYVWDYADKMQMTRFFWDAVIELHPDALEFDQGRRFPICKPEPLTALFQAGGLRGIEVRAIDVPTHFQNFDDFWMPFLGGTGAAPTYLNSFNDEQRGELRGFMQSRLPMNADGSLDLIARAWAVRGVRSA